MHDRGIDGDDEVEVRYESGGIFEIVQIGGEIDEARIAIQLSDGFFAELKAVEFDVFDVEPLRRS